MPTDSCDTSLSTQTFLYTRAAYAFPIFYSAIDEAASKPAAKAAKATPSKTHNCPYLVSIRKEAVHDSGLARGNPLAVGFHLWGACLPQAGVQLHIGGSSHAQVVGFSPTSWTQLVLVVHQALVHLPTSWQDLRAVDVHILPACLCQDDIVSEVLHLRHATDGGGGVTGTLVV